MGTGYKEFEPKGIARRYKSWRTKLSGYTVASLTMHLSATQEGASEPVVVWFGCSSSSRGAAMIRLVLLALGYCLTLFFPAELVSDWMTGLWQLRDVKHETDRA